jgi:hypothetical protein
MTIHVLRRGALLVAGLALLASGCNEGVAPALPVTAVELSHTEVKVGPTSSVVLTATPRAANGVALPDRPIVWTTSDPAIAIVSQSGVVTGVSFGVARVTATSDGKAADATISVVPTAAAHLAASWKMDSFGDKQLPAAYRLFFDEPVDDRIIAKVEIRLDSATKTMTSNARYQRRYWFTELHDDVPMFRYGWGDHGQFTLGDDVPVPLVLTSEFIQNLVTAGAVGPDGRLKLNEALWLQEELYATVWSRR